VNVVAVVVLTANMRASMDWTYANLISAREAVSGLLGRLELAEYVFVIEPRTDHCDVHVEYASRTGWKSVKLVVDDDSLLASRRDPSVRARLLNSRRAQLKDAKRSRRAAREHGAER
jgi:hypothetical protein